VLKTKELANQIRGGERKPTDPKEERDYYLERRYPSFGNLVPRATWLRATPKPFVMKGGVGCQGSAVYLSTFADAYRYVAKPSGSQVMVTV
jgi:succinate dehydrogenase / fumarate reductase flavoprotein subunit